MTSGEFELGVDLGQSEDYTTPGSVGVCDGCVPPGFPGYALLSWTRSDRVRNVWDKTNDSQKFSKVRIGIRPIEYIGLPTYVHCTLVVNDSRSVVNDPRPLYLVTIEPAGREGSDWDWYQ